MVLQIWKNENLSARAQNSHKRWIATLQATHVDIARRFQRRMRSLPKSETNNAFETAHDGSVKKVDRLDPMNKSAGSNSFKTVGRIL